MTLLARREHSCVELLQKLSKHYSDDEIALALEKLKAQNYQSDMRFATEFVQMRFNQGKGNRLISQQLKQKGIKEFDFSAFDFFVLAKQVRMQKYGKSAPKNYQQKAKQQRFLQSRGFGFDEIKFSFKA